MLWLSYTSVQDNGFDYYDSPWTYHNYIAAVGWYTRHIPFACYSTTHLSGGYALFTSREWHGRFNAPYVCEVKHGTRKITIYCSVQFNLPRHTYFKTVGDVCLAVAQYLNTTSSAAYQAVENVRIRTQAEQWQAIRLVNMECDAMIDAINKYRRMVRTAIEKRCTPIILTAEKHALRLRRASYEYIHSNALTFFDQAEKIVAEERDRCLHEHQQQQWEHIRSKK